MHYYWLEQKMVLPWRSWFCIWWLKSLVFWWGFFNTRPLLFKFNSISSLSSEQLEYILRIASLICCIPLISILTSIHHGFLHFFYDCGPLMLSLFLNLCYYYCLFVVAYFLLCSFLLVSSSAPHGPWLVWLIIVVVCCNSLLTHP